LSFHSAEKRRPLKLNCNPADMNLLAAVKNVLKYFSNLPLRDTRKAGCSKRNQRLNNFASAIPEDSNCTSANKRRLAAGMHIKSRSALTAKLASRDLRSASSYPLVPHGPHTT